MVTIKWTDAATGEHWKLTLTGPDEELQFEVLADGAWVIVPKPVAAYQVSVLYRALLVVAEVSGGQLVVDMPSFPH